MIPHERKADFEKLGTIVLAEKDHNAFNRQHKRNAETLDEDGAKEKGHHRHADLMCVVSGLPLHSPNI